MCKSIIPLLFYVSFTFFEGIDLCTHVLKSSAENKLVCTSLNLRTFPKLYLKMLKLRICKMRCRLYEMHCGVGVERGRKRRNKTLPILPIYTVIFLTIILLH